MARTGTNAALVFMFLLAGCSGGTSNESDLSIDSGAPTDVADAAIDAPAPDGKEPRTPLLATVEIEGSKHALYVQSLEGAGRRRIRFENVHTTIPGEDFPDLAVDDTRIIAFPGLSFSPDGKKLAVVASLGFDESQVVIVGIDDGSRQVASHNGQYVMGDPDWSVDGKTIAYAMSTKPIATYLEIFTTVLATNAIEQITNTGGLPHVGVGLGAPLRFDFETKAILFSELRTMEAPPYGYSSTLKRVALKSHGIDTLATGITGVIADAYRDQSRLLVVRRLSVDSSGVEDSALVLRDTASGTERTLFPHGQIVDAVFDATHENAMITVDAFGPTTDHAYSFRKIRVADGSVQTLPMPPGVGTVRDKAFFLGP